MQYPKIFDELKTYCFFYEYETNKLVNIDFVEWLTNPRYYMFCNKPFGYLRIHILALSDFSMNNLPVEFANRYCFLSAEITSRIKPDGNKKSDIHFYTDEAKNFPIPECFSLKYYGDYDSSIVIDEEGIWDSVN